MSLISVLYFQCLGYNTFIPRQSAGSYSSRETYFNVSSPPFGFSDGRVAVHARSPDAVVPSMYYVLYALLLLLTSVI